MGRCLEMVLVLGVLTLVDGASLLNLHRRDLGKATSSGFANYKDAQDTRSAREHLEAGQGAKHSVKNWTVHFPEEKTSKIQVGFDQEAIKELTGSSRRMYEDESVENNIIKLREKEMHNMAIGYLFCCRFKWCECPKCIGLCHIDLKTGAPVHRKP